MSIYYEDSSVTLHHGDCIEVLATLPDCSVDAVVTDPPYGLEFMGKEWDGPKLWRNYVTDEDRAYVSGGRTAPKFQTSRPTYAAGLPFQRWCEQWAAEALRVLKPGGHLLSFGGTRTWHRLAVAVEDAGFEIRDSIAWMYGSGFPKSLDVSKAIDKARVEDKEPTRVVCRAIRAAMDLRGLKSRDLAEHFGGCHPRLIDHWAARDTDSQPSLPTWEQWERLRELLGLGHALDAEVWRLNGRKGTPGEAWQSAEVVGTGYRVDRHEGHVNYGSGTPEGHYDLKAPATPDAAAWAGWGTALKPAFEPIVVARKPLAAGTVAANVLRYGTGAINVDGCRIEMGAEYDPAKRQRQQRSDGGVPFASAGLIGTDIPTYNPAGRWPANVVLDEDAAAELDEMSGEKSTAPMGRPSQGSSRESPGTIEVGFKSHGMPTHHSDFGGASRFFYTAKAGTDERITHNGVAHPTVKPLSLMRWLVRLVTPHGGVILEPFAGSGTTVEAAILEGFRCIAIEREADYLPLITQRINRRRDPVAYLTAAGDDLGLFGPEDAA